MELGEKTDVFQSEDIYATTTAETAYFMITPAGGGASLYEGKATVFPDGGEIRVYLNRIARGLLDAGQLPTTSGLTSNPDGMACLDIVFYGDDWIENDLPSLRVYQGAGDFPTAGMLMTTCSINGHADPRMLLFAGFSARYSFNVTIE